MLELAGYSVVTTREAELALSMTESKDFDAVLLCNTIPADMRRSLTAQLNRTSPELPVVIICTPPEKDHFKGLHAELVEDDSVVSRSLIEAIERVTV
jgi:DNA-binding response OmpR family regulator